MLILELINNHFKYYYSELVSLYLNKQKKLLFSMYIIKLFSVKN